MKLLKSTLFIAMLAFTIPSVAQIASLADIPGENPEWQQSNFVTFITTASQYLKFQSKEVTVMKITSAKTLGGYTLRVEKVTDLRTNKTASAVKLTPNSATGIGKIVGRASGGLAGNANEIYYIDESEIPVMLKAVEEMSKFDGQVPTCHTTYIYTAKGGFTFNCGFAVTAKNPIWFGQLGETGDMPLIKFKDEFMRAFQEAQKAFSELR